MISKTIDFKQVDWYAQRASAAYQSEAQIRAQFPDTVRVATVADEDVQYFLEQDPQQKLQVLSIRGTDNLENGLLDADFMPWNDKALGIYVHKGFAKSTAKLYADVRPYLKPDYVTRVTGHSLGAAIAVLTMMQLHDDGFQLDHAFNFGQPKVTNAKGGAAYGFLPLTRVVDENDVVPLVPPVTLLDSTHGRYEHLGEEVILLDGQRYVYLDQHDATRLSVDSFWHDLGHESIREHFMVNYLAHIRAKLAGAVQVPYAERERFVAAEH
ncbi:lipase family protein [Marinobacterium arenosum]|uniref:lipase family protein n=1 Tax=Marinobacterium arenosum TaxID=2862496 RepID=UPI001C97557A|nr:lipase family protein [Marinobacterium arenosum]MBY4677411.1 lipase family protein [Marinobacterium arenosum]